MVKELELDSQAADLAFSLFQQGLPPLAHPHCLPYLFAVSPKLIGAMEKHSDKYYREFPIKKRKGGVRVIQAPRRFMKLIQRWLLDHVLAAQPISDRAMGFRKGSSIFRHASEHVGNRNLLCLDIADFFPSVKRGQVDQVFGGIGFPKTVVRQLSGLCTIRGRLPQGAPTSPAIANLVFASCDDELEQLASAWGATYSRYADDLAFSGSLVFQNEHVDAIREHIQKHGFAVNATKTRWIGSGGRKVVTGLVVNSAPKPPREWRRLWRATFDRASKHPHEYTGRLAVLGGIASFVNQFDPVTAERYRTIVARIADVRTRLSTLE